MLFDPDSTLDDVALSVGMAERNLDLPWNLCRTEVYSGTALRARLEAEGRLRGDYRSYGYLMRDARAEVMFRILRVSLHERAFAMDSLLNRLISLSFARQVHEHFFPGRATDALSREVTELSVEVRRDTVKVLREALAFVQAEDVHDRRRVQQFALGQALAVGRRDVAKRQRNEALWRHLTARGTLLMARRGVAPHDRAHSGPVVAQGS